MSRGEGDTPVRPSRRAKANSGWISRVKFDNKGLVPVVVQDAGDGSVLMLAYANAEALQRTCSEGLATFWSRERKEIWVKGETSGNIMRVESIALDCDRDAVLLRVRPEGPACHTGERTCFHEPVHGAGAEPPPDGIIHEVYEVVLGRIREMPEGSYISGLVRRGQDSVLKKVGEEATEVVMAAKDGDREALTRELADLWFHTLIVMALMGVDPGEVYRELGRRRRKGK